MLNRKKVEKTPKVDLYTLIHKAQRMHLFDLSARIGRTDFSDEAEINSIERELRSMIAHLRKHAVSEETYIHPLFGEIGNQIAVIVEEHDELEKELLKLECILNEKAWENLYSALNRYIAFYLNHQDEEETMQLELLWKYFDNDRLAAVMNAFKQSLSSAENLENLKFMIPSLSILELTQMFQNIKKVSSASAFQGCCQIAESYLEASRWQKLCKSLSH